MRQQRQQPLLRKKLRHSVPGEACSPSIAKSIATKFLSIISNPHSFSLSSKFKRSIPISNRFSSPSSVVTETSFICVPAMATRAIWNGAVIAATDSYEVVEGNVYFPPSSVDMKYAKPSNTHTTCGWKGLASYYTIEVDGKENKDAAWFYPSPKPAAQNIKDYVAFWKGVTVEKAAKA